MSKLDSDAVDVMNLPNVVMMAYLRSHVHYLQPARYLLFVIKFQHWHQTSFHWAFHIIIRSTTPCPTYIQLPKFLTAKVEETPRMSSTTRSSLPILPTTTILTAATSQSNLSAQECQKSDTLLSTCLLPSLSLSLTGLLPLKHTSLRALLLTACCCNPCTLCLHRLLAQSSGCRESEEKILTKKARPLLSAPSASLSTTGGHRRPTPPPPPCIPPSIPPSLPGRARLLPLPSRLLSPTPPPPPTNPPSHHAAIKDCSFLIPRIAFFILTSRASSSEYSTFCNTGCM